MSILDRLRGKQREYYMTRAAGEAAPNVAVLGSGAWIELARAAMHELGARYERPPEHGLEVFGMKALLDRSADPEDIRVGWVTP